MQLHKYYSKKVKFGQVEGKNLRNWKQGSFLIDKLYSSSIFSRLRTLLYVNPPFEFIILLTFSRYQEISPKHFLPSFHFTSAG